MDRGRLQKKIKNIKIYNIYKEVFKSLKPESLENGFVKIRVLFHQDLDESNCVFEYKALKLRVFFIKPQVGLKSERNDDSQFEQLLTNPENMNFA